MSLPVENLTCSTCGAECDVRTWRPEPTEALYLPGGYVAPALKRKEWCAKCLRRVSATYYLVFFFIPLFPLARYRVIPTGGGYRFLGKGSLRTFDKWHIAITIGLIALMFLKG